MWKVYSLEENISGDPAGLLVITPEGEIGFLFKEDQDIEDQIVWFGIKDNLFPSWEDYAEEYPNDTYQFLAEFSSFNEMFKYHLAFWLIN